MRRAAAAHTGPRPATMAEFGLFLGVREHARDPSISRLRYPPSDATKLWSLFAHKLNWGERAALVSESDQTATRIDDLLRRIGKQIKTGDSFVFYFAGHGLQQGQDQYLLLPNTDLGKLRRGMSAGNDVLSLDSLMDSVANWRGEARCLFVLDCCRVSLEAPPGSRDGSRLDAQVEDVLAGLARRDIGLRRSGGSGQPNPPEHLSINVLNACSNHGQAYELEALDGSVFASTWGRRIQAAVAAGQPYLVDATEVDQGLATDMFEALPDTYRDRPQRPFLSRPELPFVIHRPPSEPKVTQATPAATASAAQASATTSAQLELLAKMVLRGQAEDATLALQAMGGLSDSTRTALGQWAQAHHQALADLAQAEQQVQALQAQWQQAQAAQAQDQAANAHLSTALQAAQDEAERLRAALQAAQAQLDAAVHARDQALAQQDPEGLQQALNQARVELEQVEQQRQALAVDVQGLRHDLKLAQERALEQQGLRGHEDHAFEAAKKALAESQQALQAANPARARRQRWQWSALALAVGAMAGVGAGYKAWGGELMEGISLGISAQSAQAASAAAAPPPPSPAWAAELARVAQRKLDGASPAQMQAWQQEAAQAAGVTPRFSDRLKDGGEPPEMIVVPGGRFTMGSSEAERAAWVAQGAKAEDLADEAALADVTPPSFALGRTEVTRAQFAAFVKATGHAATGGCHHYENGAWVLDAQRSWQNPGYEQGPNHPVVCVNHADAQAYARWLSAQTGHPYTLPSEAQWELAARSGTTSWRYWGDDADNKAGCAYANVANASNYSSGAWACEDGHRYTAPVSSFTPNALGLVDMLGNASEWVEDCYYTNPAGRPLDGSAWVAQCGNTRVLRGGSWLNGPQDLRSANRNRGTPDGRNFNVGFRIARTF